MRFGRKRTWRTVLAFPVGLSLGWLAAGYAGNQRAIRDAEERATQAPLPRADGRDAAEPAAGDDETTGSR
jgi:hypothetical protein